jgi:hypothetical protein
VQPKREVDAILEVQGPFEVNLGLMRGFPRRTDKVERADAGSLAL